MLVTSGLRLVLLGSNIQEASFPTQVASLSHLANPSAFGRRGVEDGRVVKSVGECVSGRGSSISLNCQTGYSRNSHSPIIIAPPVEEVLP